MTPQVQAALADLQKYLQDQIPPAEAAHAVGTLLAQPPDVLMQQVGTWAGQQSRVQALPMCDLLLHALKKVYVTGELGLLDPEAVANYLDRATGIALRLCPEDAREMLRTNLTSMRASHSRHSGALKAIVVPATPPVSVPTPVFDEEKQNARRLSLILERLANQPAGANPQMNAQAAAQMLMMGAANARNGQQLNDYIEQIRPFIGGKEGNVFVILGGGLPTWDLPGLGSSELQRPAQVGAMEKILDLAEDPTVSLNRLRDLVAAAVQKFNDGALAATVWMLDVAEEHITEKKLDPEHVEKIRRDAAEKISQVQLRNYTENKNRHGALRLVLDFFPTMSLESLFQQLSGEQRAERRRAILSVIEAHGVKARAFAFTELASKTQQENVDTYYLRNLIYVLHRIERESEAQIEQETELLAKLTARGQNIYVIKEAAAGLGYIKTEASVKLLTTRLAEFEAMLLRNDKSVYPIPEMQKLLDRIISSLTRIGTPAALLTVARHGMNANPLLGDTRARLVGLAQRDLSFDEATVEVLLKALREETPGTLLGRLIAKKEESTVHLIEALSGTRSDDVEELFRDIAERFPDQEIGRAAAQALEKRSVARQPVRESAATFSGQLEFFGLPSVMQSLAEMRATGMLTLTTKQGQVAAKLAFLEGKFVDAQKAAMRGIDALYDILERPITGAFAFVPVPAERMKSSSEPEGIMGLLLEGIRRHDELQTLIAVVPDDLVLTKTNVKPTPHEEEKDPNLVREVWLKASTGGSVGQWESQVPTDAYRIRRLVAHWMETGALVAK